MGAFRYSLDGSSKKYVCPNCNKKTFVLYVDTETGNYLTDFGKCDREQNCHYHKAPPKGKRAYLIDFLALKSISDKAYKLTDVNGIISIVPKSQILEITKNDCWITEWFLKTSTINYLSCESKYFNTDKVNIINVVTIKEPPPPIKPSFHSLELLDKMYCTNETDNLTNFLRSKFSSDEVFNATQNYLLTATNHFWSGSTIFCQIDINKNIHAGKVMKYNAQNGKRIKKPYNLINWMHIALKEPDFNLCQCLFGLHRILEDNLRTIAIVESEKTAIVMSIFLPDFIWLATGSKGNFKPELLQPIKKRNVIAYPDKGEYSSWLRIASELKLSGYKIAVSDVIEKTDFENGFDLADYYFLNALNAPNEAKTKHFISY